jgi:ketosteroid isomerase-like protein
VNKIAEIENLEDQLCRAMLASDIDTLDALLAKELIFTNHLGQCLGKESDLSAHQSGALRISKLESSEQQIKLAGDKAAVVSMRVQIAGTDAGQPADGDFRFTRVWVLSPIGHWQVVAAHSCIVNV